MSRTYPSDVSREGPSDPDAGRRWLATGLGEKALAGDEDLDAAELQRAADTLYHDKPAEERVARLKGWLSNRRATAKWGARSNR